MCIPFWEKLYNESSRKGRELLSLIKEMTDKGLDVSNGRIFLHDLTGRHGNTAIDQELRLKIHQFLSIFTRLMVGLICSCHRC